MEQYSREERQLMETIGFFNILARKYQVIMKLVKEALQKNNAKKEVKEEKKVPKENINVRTKKIYSGRIPQVKSALKAMGKITGLNENISTGSPLFANSVKFDGIELEDIGIEIEA